MRYLIPDLTPNQAYGIQFRLKNGAVVGPWSNIIRFETESDAIAPAKVTGLSLTVTGSSFLAQWNPVTTNEDGSALLDLRDYEVVIESGGVERKYYSIQPRFDITLDVNRGAFGTPKPNIKVTVRARDLSGNALLLGTAISATNPAPSAPATIEANAYGSSINVKWAGVDTDDLKEYQIYQSLDQTTWSKVWTGSATSAYIDTYIYQTHYFKVRAVDQFDQYGESAVASATPTSQFGVDVDAPDQLTGLTFTAGSALAGGAWVYYIVADWNDSAAEDLSHYEYRYSLSGINDWQYGTATESNVKITGLLPAKNYDVQVRALDLSSNASGWAIGSQVTTNDSNAPNKPSVPTVAGDTQSFLITHDLKDSAGVLLEDDLAFLRVYSGTTGFTPGPTNYLGEISVSPPSISAVAGGKFVRPAVAASGSTAVVYVKVIAVDRSGNASVPSDQAEVTLNLISNQNIADATIGDAKILELSANKLKANTAFVNNLDIQSKLTVKVGGTIESSNYSLANRTGYQIGLTNLTMFDGTISAKALELQEAAVNLVPAGYALFDYAREWYVAGTAFTVDSLVVAEQDVVTVPKFGDTSLKIVNTGGATTKKIFLANSATGYNVTVEPNTDYILSMYVRAAQVDNAGDFAIGIKGNSTGEAFVNAATANGQWTRVHFNINSGANQGILIALKMMNSGTWNIDGLQLEPRVGKLTTPSLFKLPGVTKIDGRSIRTGAISSSQIVSETALPAWSINLEGNAMLNDVWVRGKMIVGGAVYSAATQAGMTVQSYNYVAGTSGWAIKGDGSVEFVDGTFRGKIVGAQIIGASYKTAEVGRRIEIGSSGYVGQINFFAPDGSLAYLQGFSSLNSGEALRMAVDSGGPTPPLSVFAVGSNEYTFAIGRVVTALIGGYATGTPGVTMGFSVEYAPDKADMNLNRRPLLNVLVDSTTSYIDSTGSFRIYERLAAGGDRLRMFVEGNAGTLLYVPSSANFGVWEQLPDNSLRSRIHIEGNSRTVLTRVSGQDFAIADQDPVNLALFAYRFVVGDTKFFMQWYNTQTRMEVERPAIGVSDTSAMLTLLTPFNYGTKMYHKSTSTGIANRLEFRDAGDTIYEHLWAAGFVVSSSETMKGPSKRLSVGARETLDSMEIVEFQRLAGKKTKASASGEGNKSKALVAPESPATLSERIEIGVIAEHAPPAITITGEDHTPMIDLGSTLFLSIAAQQESDKIIDSLVARVTALEKIRKGQ